MIEALKKAQKDQDSRSSSRTSRPPGQPQDPPLVDVLAELKMIRALQMRVNSRTERYSKLIDGEQADKAELVEALQRLAERQQRIHRVTRDLRNGEEPMNDDHAQPGVAGSIALRASDRPTFCGGRGRRGVAPMRSPKPAAWQAPDAPKRQVAGLGLARRAARPTRPRGPRRPSSGRPCRAKRRPRPSCSPGWPTRSPWPTRTRPQLVRLCSQAAARADAARASRGWPTPKTPPLVAANLRLLYGRWLVQQSLFDEAHEQLAGLDAGRRGRPGLAAVLPGRGLPSPAEQARRA